MTKLPTTVFNVLLVLSITVAARAAVADSPGSGDKDEPAERARLVGLWKGFTVHGKGENPDRGPVKLELTFTEKSIHGIQIRETERIDHGEGEFVLDLASAPRQLDAAKTSERGRKQAYVGIYKLEGDTLMWCVSPQKVRPKTFETMKGQFLLILRKDKEKR